MSSSAKRFALPPATAGAVVVQELSREWRTISDGAGDILLALAIVEIVWYAIQIARWVVKKIRGKKVAVNELHHEWRSRKRTRIERYRPERDKKHPHYRGAA